MVTVWLWFFGFGIWDQNSKSKFELEFVSKTTSIVVRIRIVNPMLKHHFANSEFELGSGFETKILSINTRGEQFLK